MALVLTDSKSIGFRSSLWIVFLIASGIARVIAAESPDVAPVKEWAASKSLATSAASQLLMSLDTPFASDLKALSELIVEPKDIDAWKSQGVVGQLIPSVVGPARKRLPKYFLVNLFNPFAPKKYGYVDPLKPFRGERSGTRGAFDVKTSDMSGVPLFGKGW